MIWINILLLGSLYRHCYTQEQTYLVTGPRQWRIGAVETVVVQAFGQQGNFPISISVISFPDQITTYATSTIQLSPQNNYQGRVNLMIQPKDFPKPSSSDSNPFIYLKAQSNAFTKTEQVPVSYRNGFLFIQTDKPFYTPDQSVRVRVYSMDEELRPGKRKVVLTFKDPEQVKVDLMKEKDMTGIIAFPDFKIPANPRYGIWTIEAEYEKDFTTSGSASFEVKEYVLPKFLVSIEPEKNFICFDKFTKFLITVKASYYYKKNLENAKVYIRYGLIQNDQKTMLAKSIDLQMMYNGEAEFQLNSEQAVQELGYSSLEDVSGATLYITVTVEESSGRTEETENTDVKYVLSPYSMKLIATPLYVKPTLPYYINVQVRDTLGKPAGNVPVILKGTLYKEDRTTYEPTVTNLPKRSTTKQDDGTAEFVLNMPTDVSSLEFQLMTDDPDLPEGNQELSSYVAISYQSITKSYLYINWARGSEVVHVGSYQRIQLVPSSPFLAKLKYYSYLLISKGKIVGYGTEQRFQDARSHTLNIKITSEMVPSVRILAYYIVTGDTTAELVADSIWIDVVEKCLNDQNVQLSTQKKIMQPKENFPLTLSSLPNSLVALSAVDVAIYNVGKKFKRPLETVLRKVEESDLGCGAGAGENNVDVFRFAGLTFLTNANIKASQKYELKCNEILRPKRSFNFKIEIDKKGRELHRGSATSLETRQKLCINAFRDCCLFAQKLQEQLDEEMQDLGMGRMYIRTVFDLDEPEVRSYFPESWLWEEHLMDGFGTKRLSVTLPDSLTTWEFQGVGMSDKGLCVADQFQVTAYKDFFLDVQLPYSVVRGEQVQIKATVFNYKNYNVKAGLKACYSNTLSATSLTAFSFSFLPLEIGLHPINFNLRAESQSEKVIKILRVVPEGIKKVINASVTLDPQGVRGFIRRRQEMSYKIPTNTVPKAKIDRILSINGNILGEVINTVINSENVKYLINLPKGSAETELMRIVPIFYVYHFLETRNEWDLLGTNILVSQLNMERKMREGVNAIMAFRQSDYSYTVWRNGESSTWLTAFALRIFGQIKKYVNVDTTSICSSLLWVIHNCQSKDGSFKDNSGYFPVKLQGTVPSESEEMRLYLTAYVLIGMKKCEHICPVVEVRDAINLAADYLSSKIKNAKTTFTTAIGAYALACVDTSLPGARMAKQKLESEALVIESGDTVMERYWKGTSKKVDATRPSAETAQMVETTSYALLTFLKQPSKLYYNPIVRWLKQQQNYGGGFYSTQDTAIALEALTEVALTDQKLTLNMPIKVAFRKSGDFKSYQLTEKSFFTRPEEVPLPDDLVISTSSSTGVAIVHVQTVYNVISPPEKNCSFDLKIGKKAN
ncbi:hypothetical protein GDO86_014883, partial [Hymenochirus boettgeri]